MSSPTNKKIATKSNFAALMAARQQMQQEGGKSASELSITGQEAWSGENIASFSQEFVALAAKLEKIRFPGILSPPEAQRILVRLRELRRLAKSENTSLAHWQGRYVQTVIPPASSLTTAQVQLSLSHCSTKLLKRNPYMTQEHAYQTVGVPPDDWALQVLQCNPLNREMVSEILRHVFLLPLLPNMLDRLDRSAIWQRSIPQWTTVERWWKPAMTEVARESVLVPMNLVPSWPLVDVDFDASPGYPFSVMPSTPGRDKGFSTVREVLNYKTPEEIAADPKGQAEPQWFRSIMKEALGSILQPSKFATFDERFWMYSCQAGNVKHVLRSEAEKKPNRLIFNSPLTIRLLGGATSQPFYQNWQNPCSLLGTSFAHGKTIEILEKLFRVKGVEPLMEFLELRPTGDDDLMPELYALHVKRGFLAAPDKKEFDLGIRPQPQEEFKKFSEGVLPSETNVPKDQAKPLKRWHKIHRAIHDRDGRDKVVVTNHRVAVDLPYGGATGSPWTANRNTWICNAAEKAAAAASWHKVFSNRDAEAWWRFVNYGDDVLGWAHGRSEEDLKKLYEAHCNVIRDIGWEYKPETVKLTKNLSELEVLGRHIYAYVQDGKVLGFVGARPQEKLWLTLVYPKEMPKAPRGGKLDPAPVRAARLIMLADEACFYPRQWQMAQEMFTLNSKTFAVQRPAFLDTYVDMMFNVPYQGVYAPRSWGASLELHLGQPVNSVVAKAAASRPAGSDSEEELDEGDLEDFGRVPAAAGPVRQVKEKKEKEKKKLPEPESEESDLDV